MFQIVLLSLWTSGRLDCIVLRDHISSGPGLPKRALRDLFLMIFCCPIFSDFGANLAPTCLPTWTQNLDR